MICPRLLMNRGNQLPLAFAVSLSRFASRVGGGSFLRQTGFAIEPRSYSSNEGILIIARSA